MLVKTFWSFFREENPFFSIGISFVRLIRKIPILFLGVTVETQENIVPKKVANTQRANIQSKTF